MNKITVDAIKLTQILDEMVTVVKDSHALAGIVEQTYQTRIDHLRDMLTDDNIDTNSKYWRGLMDAYNVVMGHEQKQ